MKPSGSVFICSLETIDRVQLIVERLLEKNRIPFDQAELKFQIESHPSYPSLHAVTGVLDHFKVNNVAAQVSRTREMLDELPEYFIAQLGNERSNQLYLVEQSGHQCVTTDIQGHTKGLSIDEFLKSFAGVILAVEKSGQEELAQAPKNGPLKVVLAFLAVSILGIFLVSAADALTIMLLFTALAAVVISIAILQQEYGIKNTIGDAFCATDSKTTNCRAVLNSDGARVYRDYKLSDLCLMYFAGLSLVVFLLGIQGLGLTTVYFLVLLGLPVTVYSIYYQAVKIKSWCVLCLSIVGILWVQAGALLWWYPPDVTEFPTLAEIFSLGTGLLSSFTIWTYLKPKYEELRAGQKMKISYYKFKKNYHIFSSVFEKQPMTDTAIQGAAEMVFGNPGSKLEILIVTNPLCGHCKQVDSMVEDILVKYRQKVKIIIRFNIDLTSPTNDMVSIAANLTHLYETHGPEKALVAMHEAFHELSNQAWIEKWAGSKELNTQYLPQLELQKAWCTANKINFTPAILINGRSFPGEYEREDLLFFIEELHETYNPQMLNDEVLTE